MKLALAQINPVTGDLKGNKEKIINEIKNARQNSADMVIFPEMALTGYCLSDLIEDDDFVKSNKSLLDEILNYSEGIVVILGFVDYDLEKKNEDGKLRKYNAAAVMQNKKLLAIVHKTLLPNYRYFDDKRYFSAGKERNPLAIKLNGKELRLGVSICEDMWDDSYKIKPIKELVDKGVDLLININASPFSAGKFFKRQKIIQHHIGYAKTPFVYVNTVGAADNGKNIIPFDGESLVYNSEGELIALGKQFEEETIYIDLDSKKIVEKKFNREREIYEALVMSVKDYAKQIGFKKIIEPVSGGIDSALGVCICTEALGKENVIAYNLPSKFNTDTTKSIAKNLCENLGVEYRVISIQEIDSKIKEIFESQNHKINSKVAKENLHARIRGMLMMLESNDSGALLMSNGNKTEIALGYSTLYGDMCGGISLIGDLSKTDVYSLSRYVNERHGKEIIPEETFTIKPSAELSEGQYDPFDYSVTSPLVDELVEERRSPRQIIQLFKERKLNASRFIKDSEGKSVYDKHNEESFTKLAYDTYSLLRKSVYKRLQGPPIIIVTDRAFGFDLRETLINKWEGKFVEEVKNVIKN